MSFRNTLLLLLVLIGLGAYVYWVDVPEAEKEAQKEKLLDFKTEEITEIILTYPDRELALAKSGEAWKVTRPIEAEADDVAVKGLLSMISGGEVKKGLDEVTDLSPFGLDKPSTIIAMKAGDKTLPAIKIGKATPVGASAYALRGDEKKVLLTAAAVRTGADKSLKDVRNKSIFKFADDAVRKIEIASEGATIVLAKDGEMWKIESPGPYVADATTVRAYLSTLRSLRATDFPDDKAALSTYGLEAPKATVTLTLGEGGAQQTLLVGGGNDKKETYVKTASSPVVYTVGEWVSRDLAKPVDDFRDKSVLAFDREKVKSIEVSRADGAGFTLLRGDDGTWSIDKLDGPVAAAALAQYAGDLAALKGHAIAADGATDLSGWGLAPAAMAVKITGADGAELGTILLGQREVDGTREYAATRAGSGTVFLVRDFNYTRLDKQPGDFLEKPAAAGGAPPLGGVEMQDLGGEDDMGEEEEGIDVEVE